jgi:hypothetical protein
MISGACLWTPRGSIFQQIDLKLVNDYLDKILRAGVKKWRHRYAAIKLRTIVGSDRMVTVRKRSFQSKQYCIIFAIPTIFIL